MNDEQVNKAVSAVETLSELLGVPSDAVIESLADVCPEDSKLDQIYTAIYGE